MNTHLDLALALFAQSHSQLEKAVADLDDAAMAKQFPGMVNHPAWTLSHLCGAAGFILHLLDEPMNETLQQLGRTAGPGSTPSADRSAYPTKSQLLTLLKEAHTKAEPAIRAKHADYFAKQPPEAFRAFAPTVGAIVMYLITCHEPYHLGQLQQWRRAMGIGK